MQINFVCVRKLEEPTCFHFVITTLRHLKYSRQVSTLGALSLRQSELLAI